MKNFKNKLWLLFAISAGLCWGVWGVVAKFISDDVNPYMNHVLFTIGMLCTIPLVIRKCKMPALNSKGFVWGLIAGVVAVAGNVSVYYAFSSGGQASIVIPATNLYPLVTILIAIVFFKEKMNAFNVFGLLLAIPAILLLSGEPLLFTDPAGFFKALGLNNWLLYSFAALVCWGVFSACQKVTTNHISAEWSYAVFVIASVLISLIFLSTGKVNFALSQKTFVLGTIAGMLNGLGVLASFAAYRAEGKASAVTTIAGALQPMFTILLAIIFLNENFSGMEASGMLLAVIGALLLSYEKKEKTEPGSRIELPVTNKKLTYEQNAK